MKGTEKQIAWAEDIKAEVIANCDCIIRNSMADGAEFSINYVDTITAGELKAFVEDAFSKVDSAKTIIDNRSNYTYGALVRLARNVAKQNGRI